MRLRHLMLTALLLFILSNAEGEPVGKEKALQAAKQFISARHLNFSGQLTMAFQGYPHPNDASPCYYVFTQENRKGFVIVSGESGPKEVIGYSDKGEFDPSAIPDGLQYLLDWHAAEVTQARQLSPHNPQQVSATSSPTNAPRQAIAPMLTTTWDQKNPYNLKCFMADGTQSLTGCVATAMGQVMKFHEWPQNATSSIPKYTASNGMSYGALPPITFSWSKMENAYYPLHEGEEADASLQAVADLMLYCGHSVKMSYRETSAGAYTDHIPNALSSYFGYSQDVRIISRSNYNNESWCDILYEELLNRRPVLYAGSTSSSLSHLFICDGYDGYGMFHINWGASGKSNGYFSLNSLRPSVLTEEHSAFSNSQRMVIGIHPPSNGTDPAHTYLATRQLNTAEATFTYDKDTGIRKTFNYSFTSVVNLAHADAAIGLFHNGELVETPYATTNLRVLCDTTFTRKTTVSFGKNLQNGTYEIHGLNRLYGETEWRINEDTGNHYIVMQVNGNKATFTNMEEEESSNNTPALRIVSLKQVYESGVKPKQIRMVVENSSNVDFKGTAYLILDDDNSLHEGCFVDAGELTSIDFFTDKPAGSHNASIQVTGNRYNKTFDCGTLTLTDQGSLPLLTMEKLSFKNVSGNIHYGRVLDGTITLKNPTDIDYCGLLSYFIYLKDTDNKYQMSQIVNIKAGESADIPLYFENLQYGDKISIIDICDPFTSFCATTSTWTVTPGLVTWSASGKRTVKSPSYYSKIPDDAAAVSFEGLSLSNIAPNNNENTIYYFDSDAFVPTTFQGRNIVLGNKSSNFHLVDDKDFYVPYTFHTSYASYTRTPQTGFNGKGGWRTIILPFSVSSIHDSSEHGGRALSWSINYTPSTDGKNLWLREMYSIHGEEARFKDVDYWRPNVAYLIAVPDKNWGTSNDLVGHELTFSANDVDVVSTSTCKMMCNGYELVGATSHERPKEAYVLNERGDAFTLDTTPDVSPFTGYLLPVEPAGPSPTSIRIVNHSLRPGDVNGDKNVDITDVMTTVYKALKKNTDIFIHANGDLDENGEIDIVDVMSLVWLILKK